VRSLELAIKYLAGDRIIGTAAERATMPSSVETFTWAYNGASDDNSLNTFASPPQEQFGGFQFETGNAMIGKTLNSVTHVWRRRNTNSSSGTIYAKYYRAAANATTSIATSSTYSIPSLPTSNDYSGGQSVTFTFSSPPTVAVNDRVMYETALAYDQQGSPELWFRTSAGSVNTRMVSNSSNNITYIDGEDMIGTASYGTASTFYAPNGTIFEESDTGTHYMWNGTDTWNEIT